MFIAAVNLLQEVIYHRCIIVVSPLYHRCITVISGRVVTKHCSQRTKGRGGGGGGGGHPVGYNADDE